MVNENKLLLIILHGWGHNSSYWQAIKQKFEQQGAEVVAPDLPGFGKNMEFSSDWEIVDYANWLNKNMPDLADRQIIIIGHSFGGRIAGNLVARGIMNPDKLVLCGSPLIYRPNLSVSMRNNLAKWLKNFIPSALRERFRSDEYQKSHESGLSEIFKRAVTFDQTDSLKNIMIPTLILWGENDAESPKSVGEEMSNLMPKATIQIIPNAGHNWQFESPDLFVAIINKFINATD